MPVIAVIFALYVAMNTMFSQLYPPMYFHGLQNERATAVNYLKSIRSLPQYDTELAFYTSTYGDYIQQSVNYDDIRREQYIKSLQSLRQKNPVSSDVNYKLSLLYSQKGEYTLSQHYLNIAHQIDPSL